MKHPTTLRATLALLGSLCALLSNIHAAPPDATTAYIDTTYTYNLGPTGARGWIYSTGNEWTFAPEGLTTESRQIKVTQIEAGSPADGILQVNDVILGASGTAAAPLAFTSDARKAYGLAIGEAEKTANAGALKLLVWRGGSTLTVQLTLQVMGSYSATAPYACPKSTAIIQKACSFLEFHPINSTLNEGDAVIGLALLASVAPTDPTYATTQSKLQTYARSIAASNEHLTNPLDGMVAWPRGYQNVFLSEYYLATHDAAVLPAIRELTATCAKGQSLMGTYGHGMAWPKADGSSTHGYVPQYGAVNQAGETVNLGIMLGRKAIAEAGDATVDAEIDPAIERGRKYFGYFAGKGAVPYGHSPPEDLHDDNGKSGLAALLMAMQTQEDMSSQARFFAKSCTAAYSLREMGHAGPFYAHLWQPLGVNVGGPTAMAAYFKAIQWEVDLVRRWDGSLAYHSSTGATPGAPLGTDTDTACFLLTFATSLQRIYITGKGQSSSNYVAAADITEAITDGVSSLRTDLNNLTTTTSDQLVGFLSSWSAQKRSWAAAALANRADAATKVVTLLTMAADLTNLNARKGACQALGQLKPATAVSVLRDRLTDSDYHVRYYAADALKNMGAAAQPVLNDMLTTIVANQLPIEPIQWTDPVQIAQSYLGSAAFEGQLGNSVAGVSTSLLYPAITAMAQGIGRTTLMNTFENALSAADVQALASVITAAVIDDRNICDEWLAKSCIRTLAKYNVDEGIPAAMIFANQENGRSWFAYGCTDSLNALQKFGSKAAATLPTLYYWNTNPQSQSKVGMAPGAFSATIAAIENDTASHTLLNFKTINTCSASSTTVNLPAGSTTLSATASDIDGHSAALVYSWSKVRGAGGVTFSANGTSASSNTIASFNTPGTYVIRLGVTDGVFDPNKYGPVTRDLTITVLADPNRPPVAANQNVTTPLNTAKAITLAASDADGNTLTYSVVTQPASGTLTGTAPNLTYTPVTGFSGTTSFTYKANDGTLDSGIATVTITVGTSTNTTPVANNQFVTTTEDTAKAITLTGTDADAGNTLTYAIVTQPAHGNLTGTASSRTYTPAANYNGTDSFSFTVTDNIGATSGTATVVIQVSAVNDPPVASAQSLSTPESTALAITLAGSDPEGYAVTYQVSGTPGHGTLTGTAPNLTYTPTTYYNGGDSLSFTVTDSEGVVSSAATVSITVTPVNQAPVALNRSLPVTLNTATAIVLDATDVDNDPLTYTVLSQPAHGTLTGTAPNLSYTPAAGYNSTDSFTFKVNDGTVDSGNIATVYLSVGAVAPGIYSEFFQQPPNLNPWPDMANLLPNDTRIDTLLNIQYSDFPANYAGNFSSRHLAYINIAVGGDYGFSSSADDGSRVYVDEALVIQQTFPQSGYSAPVHLTPGYHGIRVEYVQNYGDRRFSVECYGPAPITASSFVHWVGDSSPAAPTHLTGLPGNAAVTLTWDAVGRAASYNIKRSLVAGGPYTTVATNVTSASYLDSGLVNATPYYYVVSSVGLNSPLMPSGEGVNSAEVTVTPSSSTIIWGPAQNDTANASDVKTNGTFVDAVTTYGNRSGSDVTLNGVTFKHYSSFTGSGPYSLAFGTSAISMTYPEYNLNFTQNTATTDYEKLRHNSMYAQNGSGTITLGNLTSGHRYQVQVWAPDWNGSISAVFDSQVTIQGNNYNQSQPSQYAVGTFTASGTTKVIDFKAGATGGYYAFVPTAVSLRDVTSTTAGPVNAGTSTVTASPASLPADGATTSTITVTLLDATNNPVAGKTVALASSRGAADTISAASGSSSPSGVVTFTVKSSTTGSAVFTATDATDSVTITPTAGVTFTAVATVSAATSTVTASPASVTANGVTTSTITVTLKDSNNNPVSGKAVTLGSSRGAADTISAASGPSSASGVVTFTVKSSTTGSAVFTATDATDGVPVNQTASVTFTAAGTAVSASNSTLVAAPSSVVADGSTTATLTATLKDSNNNGVAGKTVTVAKTSGPGSPVIATLAGTTDSSGIATFTVKSTTAGTDVFTATDATDGVVLTQTASVTFTAVPSVGGLITWGPATDVTENASDVRVNGAFVDAVTSYGNGSGADVTLNGVTFKHYSSHTGSGPYSLSFGSSGISMTYPQYNLDFLSNPATTAYQQLRHHSMYAQNGAGTITLGNLTHGRQYQVQVWAPDWNGPISAVFDSQVTIQGRNYSAGNHSQYAVGTFTASGTTQVIHFVAGATGGYYAFAPTAVSLRDVTSAPPATAYETWATNDAYAGFDLSNPTADADHDGMSNFMEFAFGLDPTVGASANPCTPLHGNQFSYTKRATSGLSYTVEYSTNLSTWNPATASESPGAADSNGIQTVTVTVSNPALNGKLFVRVQAR